MDIPRHIAIIMDGNRRWAKEHGLPPVEGHRKVADQVLEPLIEHAAKRGASYITFWAFSTENWQRADSEVKGIMQIFRHVTAKKWDILHKKGVRVKTIGDIDKFDKDIRDNLKAVVEKTKNNTTITAIFALNYGGRDEIIRAMQKIINAHKDAEAIHITESDLNRQLDTYGIPDPELIVRTSGEKRLSGFLLWQSEYSELMFPEWYMPDFTPERFDELLMEFQTRKRRFGK